MPVGHDRRAHRDGARDIAGVRPARRPPGWIPPGPPPRGDFRLEPRPDEDLCHLSGDWRIFQRRDGHRWSLDDLVTAWFATVHAPAAPGRIVDLGCGIGSVLLMLAWRFPAATVDGIEAQALSVELAHRSVAWNGVGDRCRVHHGDLRDATRLDALGHVDLVTGTPPYLVPGTAPESARPQKGPCNFQQRGGIGDYCAAAARVLAAGGVFVACAGAEAAGGRASAPQRPSRMHAAARAAGLAVTHEMAVVPRLGKPPLFSVLAMRRAPVADPARRLPPLVVRDARGVRTPAFVALRADMGLPP